MVTPTELREQADSMEAKLEATANLDIPALAADMKETTPVPANPIGWLPLDEVGTPTGPAQFAPPPPDQFVAPVIAPPTAPVSELLTPTGAPITAQMNPTPRTLMDEGFLERNPPPEAPAPKEAAESQPVAAETPVQN